MTLRRLLNVAYSALAQAKDEDELRDLDAELEAEPSATAGDRRRTAKGNRNVQALMQVSATMPRAEG